MLTKKVLIVDDEADIREIIKFYLEEEGFNILEAKSGNEAIMLAKTYSPDLITLDIILPGIDGFEVISILKKDEKTKDIPIIIISILQDEKKYRPLIADYICKPFEKKELLDSIARVLKVLEGKTIKKVLVVDDDPDVVDIIKTMLLELNYYICDAFNGIEALKKTEEERPDLIILDLKMPRLNGFEVIKKLKKDKRFLHIPIIILTATRITPKDKEYGLTLGASKYLTKPFDPRELVKEIKEVLER